jgi:hypothetical protein
VIAPFSACAEPLDTTRKAAARGTLGEEIYAVFCERLAAEQWPTDVSGRRARAFCRLGAEPDAETPPRLAALVRNRARLVAALDRALPEDLHDDLSNFLLHLLPLYEPPTDALPRLTRAAAAMLTRLASDDEVMAALERLGQRQGYRPLRLALGIARPVLAYPDLANFVDRALVTLAPGGSAGDEWRRMAEVAALELATAGPSVPRAPGERGTLELTRELLFSADDAFARGGARWLARRDGRGLAVPTRTSTGLIAPFADVDRDGLADVDALGRFVDASGARLVVATPFPLRDESPTRRDPAGRALAASGEPLYEYLDVSRTMLAGLAREAVPWLSPDRPALLDLAHGLPALLGPRAPRRERIGTAEVDFEGPDTRRGPLFDAVYATGKLIARPETDDVLAVLEVLLRDHEAELAELVDAAWVGQRAGDAYPRAAVDPRSEIWDDLLETAEGMARTPGLLEALVRALGDPASAAIGPITAIFMRHTDLVEYDPTDVNGPPLPITLTRRTDWTRPDVAGNESLFQRSIAVIQDLDGVRVCNKAGAKLRLYSSSGRELLSWPLTGSYGECELIQIDNVAETYVQAVLGRARIVLKDRTLDGLLRLAEGLGILDIDQLLEEQSGIRGLTQRPTPEALGRLVFAPPNAFIRNLLDETSFKRDRNGDGRFGADETVPIVTRHRGVVPAWEKRFVVDGVEASFIDALRPLLRAFDDFDPPGGRFYFGELCRDLHRAWPTRDASSSQRTMPGADMYSRQDDARSYEPVVATLLDEGRLFARLGALVRALDAITLRPGVDGIDALDAATVAMLDPTRSCTGGSCATGSLRYRDGRAFPCTAAGTCFDGMGGRPMRYVSPMLLLVDALSEWDRALATAPERRAAWLAGREVVASQLLSVARGPDGRMRLANRRTAAVLRLVVPFVRARIAEHRAAGDLGTWADGLAGRMESTLGSAMATTVLDWVDALRADANARAAVAALVTYLMDDTAPGEAFDATLLAIADLLQVLEDDHNLDPLVRALAPVLAADAREVAARGGTPTVDGATVDELLDLLRAIRPLDRNDVLQRVLAGLVALPESGSAETPLEALVDVIAEVNRASPGAGTTMDAADHRAVLERLRDTLVDESRGVERLYRVIQERELE